MLYLIVILNTEAPEKGINFKDVVIVCIALVVLIRVFIDLFQDLQISFNPGILISEYP